ncbi:MAG: TrkA C-terminal domain-containing protein [Sphaerochaeta sp.]|jgi:K+/H+ antiporter YhaU regulatory subunit KhtT|uniref:TrkA C-terminal domain-containing protein n=1 Tax=Sphaerochaeta sp. TaxID=1972642 RepID=UPI003D0D1E51
MDSTADKNTRAKRERKKEGGAIYERIAYDIAKRIANNEIDEGTRLSGRSLMSSEYGVSPETIRRAFALLEELEVVHVMHNSGVRVLSTEKAKTYIRKHQKHDEGRSLLQRMREILIEQESLTRELYSTAKQLFTMNNRFRESNPFPLYEYTIAEESKAIGKNLGELRFWQETGATIVAIRRDGVINLSPGPLERMVAGDILMMVGPHDCLMRTEQLFDGT